MAFLHSHSLPFPCTQFPFLPIPIPVFWLFPFPFPFPCSGPKYYELTSNLCKNQVCWKLHCSVMPTAQTYTRQVHTTGNVVAPYIKSTLKAEYCYMYSITIYHSRWWESIPMGIKVIRIPILVDSHSHSHSHVSFNSCPIPMGLPWDSHSHWDSQSHAHL